MENKKNYRVYYDTLLEMKKAGQAPNITLEVARAWFHDLNKRRPTLVHYIVKKPTESSQKS